MKIVLTLAKRKCYLFLFVVYMFVFQDLLKNYIPVLQYFDEIFALFLVFYLMVNLKKRHKLNEISVGLKIGVCVGITVVVGLISSVAYAYQPYSIVFSDMLLVLKFFLAMYVGGYTFTFLLYDRAMRRKISRHCVFLMFVFAGLTVADYIFDLFPGDTRYGLKSIQLFYFHCTVLVASIVVLISIYIMTAQEKTSVFVILSLCIIISSTLRSKAFGIVVVIIGIYIWVVKLNKKITALHLFVGAVAVFIVARGQLEYYYGVGTEEYARNLLTTNSIEILKDYFPFGTGFGTYASHFSSVSYSPVYKMYGLHTAHGLSEGRASFVSDTFWPMIFGQFGFIGTIAYVAALIIIFIAIQRQRDTNRYAYVSAIIAMTYLLISSTAESAFVNTFAVPLGMVVGMGLNYKRKRHMKG